MAHNTFTTSGKGRFVALDVLRGLTIASMLVVNNPGSWSHVYGPLLHADFNGLTPTDFVFPFFMFIMGFSIYLSLKKFTRASRSDAVRKVVGRTLKIFVLGLAINTLSMLVFRGFHPETLRILGVLQRLALSYGIVGLMVLYVRREWQLLLVALSLLVGYGAVLAVGNGYVLDSSNVVAVVDEAVLGASHMYHGEGFPFDPEGLLSTIPCVAHVLLGYIAAKVVDTYTGQSRSILLLGMGVVLMLVAILCYWLGVPFNKKVWSPSFVFATCAACSLMLGMADVVMHIAVLEKVVAPFKVMGMNCIAIFVISDLFTIFFTKVGFVGLAFDTFSAALDPKAASLLYALLFMLLNLAVAWLMYWKKIFIKL